MSDFPVSSDSYLSFDGLSIKDKIKQRLNQTGVFTDQNFEGSNISAFIDSLSMAFSLLIYNLNRTANEGNFTNAQLYENVNRIVKELDYKPVGYQSANLQYSLSATNDLSAGLYTIPRFSYISTGGYNYSFASDFSFSKNTNNAEEIDLSNYNNLLFQGSFQEFPTYSASGNNYEIIFLPKKDKIDHFNIFVFVKDATGKWSEWKKTQSLYINDANDKVYEIRFNENKTYEVKFGNDITGKKLKEGDSVAIYYLNTNGTDGEVGANVLRNKKLSNFGSSRLTSILNDIVDISTLLTATQMNYLSFDNVYKSTYYSEPETAEQIKENAPTIFRNQFALTTAKGYESFVKTNFSNIIQDVICMNNTDYKDSYIKYFYDLGLTNPQLENRALFNQFKMSDACNFNNVYLFVVPKTINNSIGYVNSAQKNLIVDTMKEEKTLTSEIVICDPVYLALDFATSSSNEVLITDVDNTILLLEKTSNNRRNDFSIISDVNTVIVDFFSRKNNKLGSTIDLLSLTNKILEINGIKKIYTKNTITGTTTEGLKMLLWNELYGNVSSSIITGNKTIENYQFFYLKSNDLTNRIQVMDNFSSVQSMNL